VLPGLLALALLAGLQAPPPRSIAEAQTRVRSLLQEDRAADAEQLLARYAANHPGDWRAHAALGDLRYSMGNYPAALQSYDTAARMNPNGRHILLRQAVCLFKTGEAGRAVEATRKLLAAGALNDTDLSLTYAEYLYQQGDYGEAAAQARQAIESDPRHPIGHFWLARILLAQRDLSGAARAAEKSVELAPQLPFARNLLVRIYRMQGRMQDSAAMAEWVRNYDASRVKK
jgi:tetratricopeptide (TPR) repeat protein